VIAGLVQAGERVMVLAGPDEAVRRQARATIDSAIGEAFGGDGEAAIAAASAAVELLDMVTDDTWLRDTGPSCVVNDAGEVRWCARSLSLSRARSLDRSVTARRFFGRAGARCELAVQRLGRRRARLPVAVRERHRLGAAVVCRRWYRGRRSLALCTSIPATVRN